MIEKQLAAVIQVPRGRLEHEAPNNVEGDERVSLHKAFHHVTVPRGRNTAQ